MKKYDEGFLSKAFDAFNYSLISLIILSIVYPFLYMFSLSVSDFKLVALQEVKLFPEGFHLTAYKSVLSSPDIMRSYLNSIIYTVCGTTGTIIICSLGGYVLSIDKFKMRFLLTTIFTIPMFFSGGLIPTYLTINNLRLIDTMWAVILPSMFSMWYMILLRTNFKQIPNSLTESAIIDGAGDLRILFKIILPLSKPIIATIAIFSAVAFWNSYFSPLLYLNTPEKYPLTIILRRILITKEVVEAGKDMLSSAQSQNNVIENIGRGISLRMATIFVTIGPIVLIYPFMQKHFIKGVLIGSIKG